MNLGSAAISGKPSFLPQNHKTCSGAWNLLVLDSYLRPDQEHLITGVKYLTQQLDDRTVNTVSSALVFISTQQNHSSGLFCHHRLATVSCY